LREEESIARRLQKREPEAWSAVYEEYFPRVFRYIALRVSNRTEAEDLTEQAFLKALESIDSFRWRGVPFPAWLFRIARNLVIDYWRTAKSKTPLPLDESLLNDDADPVAIAETNLDIKQVFQAIGQLTQSQREVIELRFVGGLSVTEVSKLLGKSEGAVKVMQHSALVALRKKLSFGGGHEAGH
jgi:RNA polymerase sigma-70 factor (ECF subfamily)